MRPKLRSFIIVAAFASSLVVATGASPASALTYPGAMEELQDCTGEEEFCVERFEFTPTGGSKIHVVDAVVPLTDQYANPGPNALPNISVFFQSAYSGPDTYSPTNPAILNVNVRNPNGGRPPEFGDGSTETGLADGTYRFVLRLGDYDPTTLMLVGRYDSYSVTKNASGHYRVDVTAKPTPLAMVMGESQYSHVALDNCEAGNWVTNCEANFASRSQIMFSFMMNPMADLREAMRGMWIASNASTLQMSAPNLATGSIGAVAKGPHYVPASFPTDGLTPENGKHLNPAHFEMGMPLEMLAKVLSTMMNTTVTVATLKTYLSDPSALLSGSISEVPAGASAVVEKAQALSVSVGDTSLRINFNLTHFSAPNPTLKIKPPASAPTTGGGQSGTTVSKRLANGATLTILKSAGKGRTLTAKAILSPSKGAAVTRIVSKSTKVCKVTGTKVKMLKSGTCKLSATVKSKGRSSTANVTVSVT